MTLERLIQIIEEFLQTQVEDKATANVHFEVPISQGGLRDCKITQQYIVKK